MTRNGAPTSRPTQHNVQCCLLVELSFILIALTLLTFALTTENTNFNTEIIPPLILFSLCSHFSLSSVLRNITAPLWLSNYNLAQKSWISELQWHFYEKKRKCPKIEFDCFDPDLLIQFWVVRISKAKDFRAPEMFSVRTFLFLFFFWGQSRGSDNAFICSNRTNLWKNFLFMIHSNKCIFSKIYF